MDLHIAETTANRACKSMLDLCFPVDAFDPPSVAGVECFIPFVPLFTSASGSQQRRIIVAKDYRFVGAPTR